MYSVHCFMAGVRQGVVIDESSGVQQVKNQNAQNALFYLRLTSFVIFCTVSCVFFLIHAVHCLPVQLRHW